MKKYILPALLILSLFCYGQVSTTSINLKESASVYRITLDGIEDFKLKYLDEVKFRHKNHMRSLKVVLVGVDQVKLYYTPDEVLIDLNFGESRYLDTDNDGVQDLKITSTPVSQYWFQLVLEQVSSVVTTTTSTSTTLVIGECNSNSNCGASIVGRQYCQNNSVYQKIRQWICTDRASIKSRCVQKNETLKIQECGMDDCIINECVSPSTTTTSTTSTTTTTIIEDVSTTLGNTSGSVTSTTIAESKPKISDSDAAILAMIEEQEKLEDPDAAIISQFEEMEKQENEGIIDKILYIPRKIFAIISFIVNSVYFWM